MDEDEAVLIALWNNAAFQELLSDLAIAHADLVQAGLLPNPEVVYFFPVSEKPFKYALDMPLEAFWLRPIRLAAAERESARVCERLTQAALDLIRDVRQSYADVLLAQGRLGVAGEAIQVRSRIRDLAHARLEAGDVSVQEAAAARIDVFQAEQERIRVAYEVQVAEERMRRLLGLGAQQTPFELNGTPPPTRPDLDVDLLVAEAIDSRPDSRASALAVAVATERARLAQVGWIRFLGILDATSGRGTGHEFSPAFRATLPVFNWNQGNVARAQAECEKARKQWQTICEQVMLDVREAHLYYHQARDELTVLDQRVQPEVEAAIRRAESAYREGNVSYVVVLEATRQLLDSRLRREQLQADLRRTWAELERSVGRRLDVPPPRPTEQESHHDVPHPPAERIVVQPDLHGGRPGRMVAGESPAGREGEGRFQSTTSDRAQAAQRRAD